MKELVVLHESHEQMMAQLAQTHAQTVDQGNALQGALQQIGQLQTVVQRLESSINQVLQRHEAAASRFKTMQDEMNFTRAECDALQVRAAAAEERAQDALDARTAREDELLSLQQRLERMQAERDQISKAFIQFRMEMLTKKQQEERNAASLPAGEDRP
jgi:chromosome segregation ATPase